MTLVTGVRRRVGAQTVDQSVGTAVLRNGVFEVPRVTILTLVDVGFEVVTVFDGVGLTCDVSRVSVFQVISWETRGAVVGSRVVGLTRLRVTHTLVGGVLPIEVG
jgi:hypothetical protein